MPFLGAPSSAGKQRVGASVATLDRTFVIPAPGGAAQTQRLPILGMSRITLCINQFAGVNTGIWAFFVVQHDTTDVTAAGAIGKIFAQGVIGAIGQPDVFTFHVVGRLCYVIVGTAPAGAGSFNVNLHASGTS